MMQEWTVATPAGKHHFLLGAIFMPLLLQLQAPAAAGPPYRLVHELAGDLQSLRREGSREHTNLQKHKREPHFLAPSKN
jgi:hypothetical protein